MVYSVYTAELVQTILFTTAAVRQFATGFGNLEALNDIGLLWFAAPILSSTSVLTFLHLFSLTDFSCLWADYTVACVVQLFYVYRIKILSKSNVIPMVVVVVKIPVLTWYSKFSFGFGE